MFERFTDRARRVIVLAQEEARNLGHAAIETDHILLAVLKEGEGVGALALNNLGFSVEFIRDRINERFGTHPPNPSFGHLPFTDEAKKTLEGSLREALQLGHNYIGTEHVLLGIVRSETPACEILAAKVELNVVRAEVIRILSSYEPKAKLAAGERVLTQAEARAALLGPSQVSSVTDAVLLCSQSLDLLPDARSRRAAVACLAAWYSESDDA